MLVMHRMAQPLLLPLLPFEYIRLIYKPLYRFTWNHPHIHVQCLNVIISASTPCSSPHFTLFLRHLVVVVWGFKIVFSNAAGNREGILSRLVQRFYTEGVHGKIFLLLRQMRVLRLSDVICLVGLFRGSNFCLGAYYISFYRLLRLCQNSLTFSLMVKTASKLRSDRTIL
jgi:hypothetical protein